MHVRGGVGVGGDVEVRVCACEKWSESGWVVVRLGVGVRVGGWE